MERQHKKDVSQNPAPVPPPPKDVLACWRWYDEVAAGDALPETYQQFDRKIEGCPVLQRLCSNPDYELKWRHALRAQLGAMWVQFDPQYPQPTIKKPSKGRPAHYERDFTFHLCVLNKIMRKLVGESDVQRQQSKYLADMVNLLRKFFPKQCREKDGWDRDRVKARINLYLRSQEHPAVAGIRKRIREQSRKHPEVLDEWYPYPDLPQDMAALVEAREGTLESMVDFVDIELKARRTPPKPKDPGPTDIIFGLDDLSSP